MGSTTTVIVHNRGGFRSVVEAGPHRLILDEPQDAGGGGEGPNPYDLLAGALGGCTAMTVQFYAKREGIPLEGIDVAVSHDRQHAKDCADCVTQAGYITRFRVEIALHGQLTPELRQRLLEVAGRCPVKRTLQSEIKVEEVLAGGG